MGLWILLLGKGYPAPTNTFRWCTERLKINPATHFLEVLANKHQSIIMLLGVRTDESIARQISITNRQLNQRGLSPHDSIPNAFVLSPIKHWLNKEVWTYLSETGNYEDMKFIEFVCEENNIAVKLIEDSMQKVHRYRHQILKVA